MDEWLGHYQQRQHKGRTDQERKQAMDGVNPKYVLRNYLARP